MRALIGMGDQKGAVSIYKQFSEKLYEDFGIMPEEETSTLYYEALRFNREFALPMETVMKQLQEEDAAEGAMICEYDFFRVLYRSIARSMERNGMTAHVALLTLNGEPGEELSRRRMEGTMGRLEEQLRLNLRRGDVAAKCSGSQYVLILPQANYENSCKVCERVCKAFGRRYPHAEVVIDYEIWPIRPDDNYF